MINIVGILREDAALGDEEIAERCECSEEEVQVIRKALYE